MSQKQIDRRTLLLGAVTLTAGGFLCNSAQAEDVAKLQTLKAGKPRLSPVDLQLSGPDGNTGSLTAQRGKPFLLHVWATWCGPCKRELPQLDAFYAKLESPAIIPVAVDSGTPEKVDAFLKKAGLSHLPAWTIDKHKFKEWLGTPQFAIPVTFLIDAKGLVRATSEGGIDWAAPDAMAQYQAILASAGN